MKPSPKEKWCLRYLAENGPASVADVSIAAERRGLNRTRYTTEWAYGPLRFLRIYGLVEDGAHLHKCAVQKRITQAGRDWLAANP